MQSGLVLRFMFTVWLCRGTMWAAVTMGSSAHYQQLDVCATQFNGSNLHGVISLWPLARKDGLPRFTTKFNVSNHSWNYSFNPCENFDVLLDNPDQGARNQCHHVAVCKYNQVESYNLGTHDTANFKVQTDSSDNVKVQLIYTNNKSAPAQDFIIDLICDENRSEPDSGLFRVIGNNGKGALVSELHHQCCCVGGCPYDSPGVSGKDKKSGETLLFVVGAAVAVSLMAVLLGGLCFIWRRHQQAYSGLSGVKRKGADVGPELGAKTDLRDYEPAAVVQKKVLPVLKDITIHWGSLEMCQRLGGGIFGDTHLAKWHAMTVAVKRLTLLVHENQITPDALKLMKEEVWFLSRQRHKNIVTILGLCLDGKLPSIITEYVIGECLKDFIKVQGRLLSWPHRVRICLQVADGMAFLHSTKPPIIHRDLRCGNLFLTDDDVVKVADFGLIKLLQPVREECPQDDCCCRRTMSACPASIRWTAPELLTQPVTQEPASPDAADQGRLDSERQGGSQRRAVTPACDVITPACDVITPACDVYSFAMVMWELPMCVDPFDGIALESEVMDVVKNGGRPETPASADMMPQYKELMKGCWHQIPSERPTFKQIGRQLRDLGAQARTYQKQLQNQQRMQKLQKNSTLLM